MHNTVKRWHWSDGVGISRKQKPCELITVDFQAWTWLLMCLTKYRLLHIVNGMEGNEWCERYGDCLLYLGLQEETARDKKEGIWVLWFREAKCKSSNSKLMGRCETTNVCWQVRKTDRQLNVKRKKAGGEEGADEWETFECQSYTHTSS